MKRSPWQAGLLCVALALALLPWLPASVAQDRSGLRSTWTVANDSNSELKVTLERRRFQAQRRVAPGEALRMRLASGVYRVTLREDDRSEVESFVLDLRDGRAVVTHYPLDPPLGEPRPSSDLGEEPDVDERLDDALLREHGEDPPDAFEIPQRELTPWRYSGVSGLFTIEAFVGVAFVAGTDLEVVEREEDRWYDAGDARTAGKVSLSAKTRLTYGLRFGFAWDVAGRYTDTVQLGMALEWSQFESSGGLIERFDTNAVALLLHGRMLVGRSAYRPLGQFQINVGLGLGIYVNDVVIHVPNVPTNAIDPLPPTVDETITDLGFEFRLGAAVPLVDRVALFVEYRFSYFGYSADIGDTPPTWSWEEGDVFLERDVVVNHILAGLSLQF